MSAKVIATIRMSYNVRPVYQEQLNGGEQSENTGCSDDR